MRTLSLLAALLAASPAVAQRDAKVPDPDPEVERRTFVVPDGFEVNLFAADPMLAKPIQMNFDPRGRLWVAASEVYPQIKPGQKANDKVLILEDTNGDGKADKTTVFTDGLLIPTGVAPGDGGAYVADSTDLVHFSDPDPATGKAQKKRIVLSGFGTEDTHHILHTLRWGPDGCLYMNQSIYIHSHIETPHGVRRLNAGGVWRFRLETGRLDVFARGFINPWGTAFDRWGNSFATDGAHSFGVTPLIPGAYYPTAYGAARTLQGLTPGSPKHCGLAVLSGRHLPPEYQGDFVTNDFRGHRVCRFTLKDDGSGWAAQEKQELIRSTHPAFRPIDVAMGPDGAVYVADWYNPIIQHGEVDFRDPRRDKTHGRIWRITAKGRPLVSKPKLADATVPELLDRMKSPEDWTRQMTRQVLKERGGKAVVPELEKWLAALEPKADGFERARLEGLWTYQSLNVAAPELLGTLLGSKQPGVRAAACRVSGQWVTRPDCQGVSSLLDERATDDHPRVRLEAVRALAECRDDRAAEGAAVALDKPMDKWLDYAVWLTMRELTPHWLPEVQSGKLDFGGDPKKLVFALQAAGSADVVGPLRRLLDAGKVTGDRELEVYTLLAKHGGSADLGRVLKRVNVRHAEEPVAARLLTAVEDAVRARKVGPPADIAALYFFLDEHTGPTRQAASRLAGLWKDEGLRPMLQHLANGKPQVKPVSDDDRRAALDGLVSLGGPKSVAFLTGFTDYANPRYQAWAAAALARLDLKQGTTRVVRLLNTLQPADLSELLTAILGRTGGASALTSAILALDGGTIQPDSARIGVRVAKAAGKDGEALAAAFTKIGKLTDSRWVLAGADLDRFLAELPAADPARGEAVFRRTELQCLKCHAVAGAGGQVGAELTSIGASAQPDYLIESLLNPNAKIKEGYNSLIVSTEDGRTATGIKVRETDTELILRDADDKLLTFAKADIASRKDGKSLMPDGLVDSLTRQELADLTRFLSELGKGAYAATPGRTVRTWEVLQPTRPAFDLLGRKGFGAIPTESGLTWAPAYSVVAGGLAVAELPTVQVNRESPKQVAVRFRVEVTTPGKVKLLFADPAGLSLWVDGVPAGVSSETTLDLAAGVQTITIGVEPSNRSAPLRIELADAPGSVARARLVGGK